MTTKLLTLIIAVLIALIAAPVSASAQTGTEPESWAFADRSESTLILVTRIESDIASVMVYDLVSPAFVADTFTVPERSVTEQNVEELAIPGADVIRAFTFRYDGFDTILFTIATDDAVYLFLLAGSSLDGDDGRMFGAFMAETIMLGLVLPPDGFHDVDPDDL